MGTIVKTVVTTIISSIILSGVRVSARPPQIAPTVATANSFDYVSDSVTGLSTEMLSREEIETLMKDYGKFDGPMGMPFEEYKEAMSAKWTDCTRYRLWGKTTKDINIDLTRAYTYDHLIRFMSYLSGREGVYLFDIGETSAGQRMYALEVDIPSDKEKQVVVLTGNIHARETAGSTFILKEISELLQSETEEAREILETTKFAIVACVNPDGRDGVAFKTSEYTYDSGQLWKATSNGTDLNRNFPGLSWSQIYKDYSKADLVSNSPKKLYYPGDYAGSCNETKAMMKFLYHYIVLEKAQVLIDYHQQGRIAYAGKPWQTDEQQKRCKELAKFFFKRMNVGNGDNTYYWLGEEKDYDLNGTGSTLTDFAVSLSVGAKFSPAYGFYVYTDGENEYPLIMVPRLGKTELDVLRETNSKFATTTFEIGYGSDYLGYTKSTRKLLDKEYSNYHFDEVLYYLREYFNQ